MCAQPFSGISFIKYDYSQYILELNKITKKIWEQKQAKWLEHENKKLAKITYA